ncbi:two-partner secretion domain-containing protein [Scytonema sp. HK-05]|nr:filamentous hemagglutinin N-terminal domain-containing protein [Scytonema sp. HK-05]
MTVCWWRWHWKLALASWLAIGGAYASFGDCAVAQITPDSTLPNNSSVRTQDNIRIISGGTKAGSNLFHSFSEFSVPNGGTAFFNNALDIENIISRVTGKSISNIDGLIRANGTANLFLINPNGIVFGQNARLNIGGSFVATTASAIQFGNQGFFSADNPNTPPLLTVNPSALLFNQIRAASIQNNSIADSGLNPSSEFTATGLRVPDGKSLLLVGGDINIDGGGLYAFGGRVELGGLAGAGRVGLNGDGNNLSLSFPDNVERSDVFLSNSAVVNVRAGNGGSIAVNARNLEMTAESSLSAGIESRLGSSNTKAGNIEVNATGVINLNNGSRIANDVRPEGNGQGGDVNISASTLQVSGGAQVGAVTFGEGKGGNLTVNAQDVQTISRSVDNRVASGLFTSAERNSTGDAGDLTIKTNTLLVRDGAQVAASTFGAGKGGSLRVDAQDVQLIGTNADSQFPSRLGADAQPNSTGDGRSLTIKTNTLLVRDGAQVGTGTFGKGNGGNLSVDAQDVQVIGTSADNRVASTLSASANRNSTGDAGNLTVKTNTLLVRDGAQVGTGTFGKGKGGNLSVDAQDVQVIGESADNRLGSGLFVSAAQNSTGNAGDLTVKTNTLLVQNGAQVNASTLGAGKGGNLTIKTNTLLVQNGAQVSAGTFGKGKGGNLTVDAQDVQLIGRSADDQFASDLSTSAQRNSTGSAGDLTVRTNTLLVRDGAQIVTGTFGAGKGGNLSVDAQDVQVIGTSADNRVASGLFTSANRNSTGDAGNLTIKTNTLLARDGAQVGTGTFGSGKGGSLSVDAKDVQLIGRSADNQRVTGLFASAQPNSTGDAGNLTIKTNTLLVQDGARVAVQSSGTGTAGNMTVNARSIRLDNDVLLTANTQSAKVDPNTEQATININSQDLIMRRNSNIRTNATGENVIGGNINIDTDVLAAFENSDISANSANFRGGQVRIKTQGIFGIQSRKEPSSQTSDITATGASPELSGTVEINTPDIDPNTGLVNLPAVPVDTRVAQGCTAGGNEAKSSFIITGRGGLPPNPGEALSTDAVQVDLITLNSEVAQPSTTAVSTTPTSPTPPPIVEATGWVVDANGDIILTANAPTVTPHNSWQTPTKCSAPKPS